MAEKIAMLPEGERVRTLRELAPTDEDVKALLYTWAFWARPNQVEPPAPWSTWTLLSGRGFGKTRVGAECVIKRARHGPFYPMALIGQTKADVRDTMVEVFESSIMKVSPPSFMPKLETTKRRVTWPNGMQAIMYSGDEPDQLRGPQHGFGWLDEIGKYKYPDVTMSNFRLGLRLGPTPQAVITTTPRPIPVIKELVDDPNVVITTGSTFENMSNLPESFIRTILRKYDGTRLGAQELYGRILGDIEGALWSRQMLEDTRVVRLPSIFRVVVAVDPNAGGANEMGTSETGIIAVGMGVDGDCYVLEDASVESNKPEVWAQQAVATYNRYQADAVVAEVNQGGEMVKYTLQTIDANLPVIMVHASKAKHTRAEPVSNLYAGKRIHHLGMFPDLEEQLCGWVPGEPSPDRLDALVWGITELMLKSGNNMPLDEIYQLFEWI